LKVQLFLDDIHKNRLNPAMTLPTLDQLKRALHLGERIEELKAEMAALLGKAGAKVLNIAESGMIAATKKIHAINVSRKKGGITPAGRAAIAAAQKARWAKIKKGDKSASKAPAVARKKTKISAQGLANIRAAQKARWAQVKAGKANA
jgi:hypothetical protein